MPFSEPNANYKDFSLLSSNNIKELDCTVKEVLHTPSGAKIIHIDNDDPENLFCLSFQTLPTSSNGVPHILEHIVLCGSEKFPVKDPFFSMTRRSLNTFMNAMTGSDFTCYPAASLVEKDFYNLLEVYLDATFAASIRKNSLLQEGWRLEFAKANDPTSPLEYKGIVYNEMKGALSTGESRMWVALLKELLPDLPYAHNYGGDPKEIPSLSYEELVSFYKENYHPSRCLFFFYGNLPLQKHLDFLDEHLLKEATSLPPAPPIAKQPRFKKPVNFSLPYSVSENESYDNKFLVSFGWLTCSSLSQEEVLALSVIDSILTETDASPLKKALLQSKLCTQADAFLEAEISEVPYIIVCKGCKKENIDSLESLLLKTLEEIASTPFTQEMIDAAIHQIELAKTEISSDHSPFGLTLFFRAALAKQHGCSLQETLEVHTLFAKLQEKVQDPNYLPSLMQKHLIQNPHRVRITMEPDPKLPEKEKKEESAKLQEIQKKLSKEDAKAIIAVAKELEKEQDEECEDEDLSCLPKVTLADVPKVGASFPLKEKQSLYHHSCFTNHLLYADILFDLPSIEMEEVPYLNLLLSLIPELGAAGRSYEENLKFMEKHTGGISMGCSLHIQTDDPLTTKPTLAIRGKSLARKADKLLPFLQETLTSPDLKDHKRIEEKLNQVRTALQNKVTKNGMRYAINLALSGFSMGTAFSHSAYGLGYYSFIEEVQKDKKQLVDRLLALYEKVFTFHNPSLVLSCDDALVEQMDRENLLSLHLPKKDFTPFASPFTPKEIPSQGKIIPASVAFNARGYFVSGFSGENAPALSVAAELMENKVLHNKIREIGGAYGSSATYSPMSGCFYLSSYRDPHISSTFTAFDEACHKIAKKDFCERNLEEAKLGVIQGIDSPVAPGSRALVSVNRALANKTDEKRQAFREKVLAIDPSSIQKAVEEELLAKKGIDVSFAGEKLLEKHGKLPFSAL